MPWICPECEKEFRNKNQWHSCARVDLGAHLKGKSAETKRTFEELMRGVRGLGEVAINPVKTAIQVKAGATFLSIRPKKDYIEIEFQSQRVIKEFPVYRSMKISRNRVLHFAILESPEEVDARLMKWLRESYQLVVKQKSRE